MPDYSLERLSTRSFEQLVQSLAQKYLGARTVIFGDGPDGGREAEFKGVFKLPPLNEQWKGRVLIQAKFLQTPFAKPTQNSSWLLDQLAKEMKKFSRRSTKRKPKLSSPDYYVLATNIANSGVAKKGGKDRITKAMNLYKQALAWKGWVLWDYNELGRMLDDAADIRTAYAAWVTSGDVLTEMLRSLKGASPDFRQAMFSRLQQDFCNAQYAKLRQAGHGSEDKTPLSRLFVDLPIANSPLVDPPEETTDADEAAGREPRKLPTFLETLLEKGDERLAPSAIDEASMQTSAISHIEYFVPKNKFFATEVSRGDVPNLVVHGVHGKIDLDRVEFSYDFGGWDPRTNRVVLLGGPGQGKTTVGQFACQLYRAALLGASAKPLMQETRDALHTFEQQCGKGICRPSARRYPVWIDLKEIAKWLAKLPDDPPPSLLTFIAKRIDTDCKARDLKEWLRIYPWFIVFDGLDEVPPSSGRERMLRCIQSFVTEAHTLGSDLLVLCTTRPQGYSKEFDQRYYRHQWLAPLSPERALAYGEKVLDARHGKSGDDRQTFGARLAQAAANPMTARVMRSPLQVTIMAALVERVGKPPEQRWKLFTEYYTVIYERERERGTAWSDALAKYDAEVDAIHRRVGWRLQVRSEAAKNSDARLSAVEFKEEVSSQLAKEGHKGEDLDALVALLGDAATERLVFLVAVGNEEVGFEIRPLQEFMAADHLFDQGDQVAADHLKVIAPVAYWRNVFLFASGRVFADRRNLRDHLLGVLDHLNEDGEQPAAKLTLAGSILALDILEDGSANHIPASRDALTRKACRLLDIALHLEHRRLAAVSLRSGGAPLLREEIEKRLVGGEPEAFEGAKACLASALRHANWAVDLWLAHLPINISLVSYILGAERDCPLSPAFMEAAATAVKKNSPLSIDFFWLSPPQLRELLPMPLIEAVATLDAQAVNFHDTANAKLPIGLIWRPIFSRDIGAKAEPEPDLTGFHPDWKLRWIDYRFRKKPSTEALAIALEALPQATSWPISHDRVGALSWPIVGALGDCTSREDISSLAARARTGELGDTDRWRAFEQVVLRNGFHIEEAASLLAVENTGPFDIRSAARDAGLSIQGLWSIVDNSRIFASRADHQTPHTFDKLVDRLLGRLVSRNRRFAAKVVESFARMEEPPEFSIATFIKVASSSAGGRLPVSQSWLEARLLQTAREGEGVSAECDSFGEHVSDMQRAGTMLHESTIRAVSEVAVAIEKRPTEAGLWRLLSLLPCVPDPLIYRKTLEALPKTLAHGSADITVLSIRAHLWTVHSAPQFAAEIIESLSGRADVVNVLSEALEHVALSDFAIESLPAALLERLPRDDRPNRSIIRESLRQLHLKRPSNLKESDDDSPQVPNE